MLCDKLSIERKLPAWVFSIDGDLPFYLVQAIHKLLAIKYLCVSMFYD